MIWILSDISKFKWKCDHLYYCLIKTVEISDVSSHTKNAKKKQSSKRQIRHGDLNEKFPHYCMCLSIRFIVNGILEKIIHKTFRGGVLLEGEGHWRLALKFYSLVSPPVWPLCFLHDWNYGQPTSLSYFLVHHQEASKANIGHEWQVTSNLVPNVYSL